MYTFSLTPLTLLLASMIPPPMPFSPQGETTPQSKGHATTEVRTDVGWVGPSQTFNIIVSITPDKDWHVYWKHAGASGSPTQFSIDAPEGYIVGTPVYPRPSIFQSNDGETFGYDECAAIFIPVTAPSNVVDGQVSFEVTTTWLACREKRVQGEEKKEMLVSVHAHQQGPKHRDMRLSAWAQRLPRELSDLEHGGCTVAGSTLNIVGQSDLRPIRFIGVDNKAVQFGEQEFATEHKNVFRLPVAISIDFFANEKKTVVVEGLLLLGRDDKDPAYTVRIVVDSENYLQKQNGKTIAN